jgi:hypothetical protein
MKKILTSLLLFSSVFASAQVEDSIKVLFIGNSYTYTNNLPQMLADMATSTEKEVVFESSTPGGYTFQGHVSNTTSNQLIHEGDWNFVVLQEQSQIPSFPLEQVEVECFPFAAQLNDTIEAYNPCAETVFYMTWGRQNGDAQNCAGWPPVCTYEGMDDLLNERYRAMAEDNEAILSPVGALWRYLRTNYPDINLYSSDGSHPNATGTYAAAVCFYTVMFREDPSDLTYNSTIDAATAQIIRDAAKIVVYDELLEKWHVGEYDAAMSECYNTVGITEPTAGEFSAFFRQNEWVMVSNTISQADIITLYDAQGRAVATRTQVTLPHYESLPSLPAGIYFYECRIGDQIFTGKINR